MIRDIVNLEKLDAYLRQQVEEANAVRRIVGEPEYRLVVGSPPSPAPVKDNGPAVKAIKKAKKKAHGLPTAPSGRLIEWARKHSRVFDPEKFREANPGLGMRSLANLVVTGVFKKRANGSYTLTE
jgi:hypothetical protein